MNKRLEKHLRKHQPSNALPGASRPRPIPGSTKPVINKITPIPPRASAQPHRSPAPSSRVSVQPTHWADVADWYDQLVGDEGSEYHREVILPGIFRMLNLDKPRITNREPQAMALPHILDLACGQGVLCRKLAAKGCTVAGIDAAEPLIAAARRRNDKDHLSIRYDIADATKLLSDQKGGNVLAAGLTPASFDAITIVLAIQNITPLSPVWHACKTLLKPGGSLLLVMMHPCFRIPKDSDWLWENTGSGGIGAQGRVVYSYLTSSKIDIQTHPGLAAHGKSAASTPHFHRPLQAYINTLGNAGLLIDHIEEWPSHKTSQPGPKKSALDRSRKEIPMFLAIRAKRM